MKYAQEKGGQRLHLVRELDPHLDGAPVSLTALCGKTVQRWGMVINVTLGMACGNCTRVWSRLRGTVYTLPPPAGRSTRVDDVTKGSHKVTPQPSDMSNERLSE